MTKKTWTTPTLDELMVEDTQSGIPTPLGEGIFVPANGGPGIPLGS